MLTLGAGERGCQPVFEGMPVLIVICIPEPTVITASSLPDRVNRDVSRGRQRGPMPEMGVAAHGEQEKKLEPGQEALFVRGSLRAVSELKGSSCPSARSRSRNTKRQIARV
jgi:hypothetical protein